MVTLAGDNDHVDGYRQQPPGDVTSARTRDNVCAALIDSFVNNVIVSRSNQSHYNLESAKYSPVSMIQLPIVNEQEVSQNGRGISVDN